MARDDQTPRGVPIGRLRAPRVPDLEQMAISESSHGRLLAELGQLHRRIDEMAEGTAAVRRVDGWIRSARVRAAIGAVLLAVLGGFGTAVATVIDAASEVRVLSREVERTQEASAEVDADQRALTNSMHELASNLGQLAVSFREYRQARDERDAELGDRVRDLERAAMAANRAATRANRAASEAERTTARAAGAR